MTFLTPTSVLLVSIFLGSIPVLNAVQACEVEVCSLFSIVSMIDCFVDASCTSFFYAEFSIKVSVSHVHLILKRLKHDV